MTMTSSPLHLLLISVLLLNLNPSATVTAQNSPAPTPMPVDTYYEALSDPIVRTTSPTPDTATSFGRGEQPSKSPTLRPTNPPTSEGMGLNDVVVDLPGVDMSSDDNGGDDNGVVGLDDGGDMGGMVLISTESVSPVEAPKKASVESSSADDTTDVPTVAPVEEEEEEVETRGAFKEVETNVSGGAVGARMGNAAVLLGAVFGSMMLFAGLQ